MWLGSAGSSPVCTIAYLPPDHRRGREYDSIMCTDCCVASRIIPWGKQSHIRDYNMLKMGKLPKNKTYVLK